ncbi:hypothetical protein P389DRAFT_169359, partial [Cystobasidium minutum MCA 4210]|uniref:uncharacterized protein n=1 Tax=Cystobasidium minutum MCA 4210 TaxID=1397322 RepID=UPI0034CDF69B|eukprot:jgi/Rhomi1/169359/fgenesh1_kg.3_\
MFANNPAGPAGLFDSPAPLSEPDSLSAPSMFLALVALVGDSRLLLALFDVRSGLDGLSLCAAGLSRGLGVLRAAVRPVPLMARSI